MSERALFIRRKLGRRLRALRERAGLSMAEAADRLDKSHSTMHRLATGLTRTDVHLARSIMDIYDPDLLDEVREAYRPGWWTTYGLSDMGYVDVETEAAEVQELALLHLPGLLQTESYMHAVFEAGQLERTSMQLWADIAVRRVRQLRLTDQDNPLRLITLVDEGELRKPIGGRDVMWEQLGRLVELAELPTVTLRVLPDELGGHGGLSGAFLLLSFPDPADVDLLYVSYPTGSVHVENPDEVRRAKLLFAHLGERALSPADSVALIERVRAERYGPD